MRGTIARERLQQLLADPLAATSLEYGIAGGLAALLLGLAFLRAGPHLADALARVINRLQGGHPTL